MFVLAYHRGLATTLISKALPPSKWTRCENLRNLVLLGLSTHQASTKQKGKKTLFWQLK